MELVQSLKVAWSTYFSSDCTATHIHVYKTVNYITNLNVCVCIMDYLIKISSIRCLNIQQHKWSASDLKMEWNDTFRWPNATCSGLCNVSKYKVLGTNIVLGTTSGGSWPEYIKIFGRYSQNLKLLFVIS